MTDEIYVRLVDFPTTKVSEAVTQNVDGSYTIFINSKMANREQISAYAHALRHIKSGDFEKNDVNEIEKKAHEE